MKHKLLLGASKNGKHLTRAMQKNLREIAEVTVWDQGIFQISSNKLQDLLRALEQTDFAAFLLTENDMADLNSDQRDLMFLLGLFAGRMGGMERLFLVIPEHSTIEHLPSMMSGFTPGMYETSRTNQNWESATAVVCGEMEEKMLQLGKRDPHIRETEHPKKQSLIDLMYAAIKHARFRSVQLNRLLASLMETFDSNCDKIILPKVTAATFFQLSADQSCLEQIGWTGDVNSGHSYRLDDDSKWVIQCYKKRVMMMMTADEEALVPILENREYIICIPLNAEVILTVHVKTKSPIPKNLYQTVLDQLYENNEIRFAILKTILERRDSDETARKGIPRESYNA